MAKKVVVIGAGYAGATVAYALEKKSDFEVTVIDPKDFFYHTFGGIRNVADGAWVDKVVIPYNFKKANLIKGKATKIDFSANSVEVDVSGTKETHPFDYAIIATGSKNRFPANLESVIGDGGDLTAKLKKVSTDVEAAKDIVFIGGGAAGVEMAAEVKGKYGDTKNVTICHSQEKLIDTTFPEKFHEKLAKSLEKLDVKVVLGNRASIVGNTEAMENWDQYVKGDNTVKSGETEIKADLVFLTTGNVMNNSLMQESDPSKLEESGKIKVNKFAQVEGTENVFAIGDIANSDARNLAFIAGKAGLGCIFNIVQHSKGNAKKMKDVMKGIPQGPTCFLAIGAKDGVAVMNGKAMPNFLPKKMKAGGLMVKAQWKLNNGKMPK